MSTAMDFVETAEQLAPGERLWLVDQIWDGLPPDVWSLPSADEVANRAYSYGSSAQCAAQVL